LAQIKLEEHRSNSVVYIINVQSSFEQLTPVAILILQLVKLIKINPKTAEAKSGKRVWMKAIGRLFSQSTEL